MRRRDPVRSNPISRIAVLKSSNFTQFLSRIATVDREAAANPGNFPQFFPQVWKTLGRDRSGISLVQTRRPEVARPWENGKGRQTVTHAAV